MPRGRDQDDSDDGVPSRAGWWERLKGAMLKPETATGKAGDAPVAEPRTVEQLEAAVKSADDRERAVGLVAAPLAGLIAIIVTGSLISNDPAAGTRLHVNPSQYAELGGSLVVLSLVMLAMAWFRKRLFLGITAALYGLGIFNLHYWGFGVPFILVGAWLLVRSYRLQRELKEATADGPSARGAASGPSPGPAKRPQPNKRYTPKTPPPPPPTNSKKRRGQAADGPPAQDDEPVED